MSDFASLTHKFRAAIDDGLGGNRVIKRNRLPLSCGPCRTKKLKCDRGHPCDTCIKRDDIVNCTYTRTAASAGTAASTRPEGRIAGSNGKAQERLRHLEELVIKLVEQNEADSNGNKTFSHTGNPERVAENHTSTTSQEGHLQIGSSGARYVGSTHWSAILEDIQEIKTALGADDVSSSNFEEPEDIDVQECETLFGKVGSLSLVQILSQSLPPRIEVDRRLSVYFTSRYGVHPFIHSLDFNDRYEEFWRAPLDAPPLWVAILFSICCVSATLSEAVGHEPPVEEGQIRPRVAFENAACQCLRLGGFLRPQKFVIEALLLYCWCKYLSVMDPSREVGIVFAMIVRLAYRSGYHRDSSLFPHISVFDGEMRRRSWAACRQFDLMLSFQLGLPTHVSPDSWDTQIPRNLLDSDFSRDCKELPMSRPESEATTILYFVVKTRLVTAFSKSCAHALSFANRSREEVIELDAKIRKVYETVPEILRIRPISRSFSDPSYLIMQRLNCQFLYQKSLLVLHRKYMAQADSTGSRDACTKAATTIVTYMLEIHKELQPTGRLHGDRWMLSSFSLNDFHLATMVLCLTISMWKAANPSKDVSEDQEITSRIQLLISAHEVCRDFAATSSEARRVAEVLCVVLEKHPTPGQKRCSPRPSPFSHRSIGLTYQDAQPAPSYPPQTSQSLSDSHLLNLEPLSLSDVGSTKQELSSPSHNSSSQQFTQKAGSAAQSDLRRDNGMSTTSISYGINAILPNESNPHYQSTSRQNLASDFLPYIQFVPFTLNHPDSNMIQEPDMTIAASQPQPDLPSPNWNPFNGEMDWQYIDQWLSLPGPELDPRVELNPLQSTMGLPSFRNSPIDQPSRNQATAVDTDWHNATFAFHGNELSRAQQTEMRGEQAGGMEQNQSFDPPP